MKSSLRLSLLAAFSLWAFPTLAADSTVTAMPAAGALTGPELFYCIQGGVDSKCTASQVQTFGGGPPGGASLTLQYNNAGAFGGMAGTAWDNTNRSLTITGVTVATSKPILNLTQTWDDGPGDVAFTGIFLNVTNVASNAASLLMDLQFGGTSRLSVSRVGLVTAASDVISGTTIRVANDAGRFTLGAASDVMLSRNAAAGLQFGNANVDLNASIVAQTISFQGALSGGTANQAGKVATIDGSRGKGTGVGGNINMRVTLAGASGTAINPYVDAITLDASAAVPRITAGGPVKLKGYTVATLPTGSAGDQALVTDQLTACPALDGTFTGGGVVECKATFANGAWVHE